MGNLSFEQKILIAPCGMNCGICIGYIREKNKCPGCNIESQKKPQHCMSCIIKNCEYLQESQSGFCYACEKYPCRRLKQLDKRYRAKYHMSMLENLAYIKQYGLEKFVKNEDRRWRCTSCNGQLSAHRENCLECGREQVWEM